MNNDLTIQTHLRGLSGAGQLGGIPELPRIEEISKGSAGPTEGANFKNMLTESIGKVNTLMNQSDQAVADLASGKTKNMHQTLLSLQKADF
jgi:flagellar hook-basal body complex protein FliE